MLGSALPRLVSRVGEVLGAGGVWMTYGVGSVRGGSGGEEKWEMVELHLGVQKKRDVGGSPGSALAPATPTRTDTKKTETAVESTRISQLDTFTTNDTVSLPHNPHTPTIPPAPPVRPQLHSPRLERTAIAGLCAALGVLVLLIVGVALGLYVRGRKKSGEAEEVVDGVGVEDGVVGVDEKSGGYVVVMEREEGWKVEGRRGMSLPRRMW